MSREEVMDEVWTPPSVQGKQYEFDPDEEEVTVVPHDQAVKYEHREREEPRSPAGVAQLRNIPNADDLHDQRIKALQGAIQAAIDFLSLPKTGAKAWANDLHYRERLTNKKGNGLLDKAVEECRTALDFISVQEDQ